ncbi:BPSL0761 family protein [Burkholderia ubonensis]|uniref:BPSL0761 family protein n=1 Tax=Burkholderia ubonensis TaxID=101571 RepID=UPI000B187B2A|nr:BPSL0761 family protein [Burkholderia ubonensis]
MTTADERTNAVVETRAFLQMLASDSNCAPHNDLRELAVRLLRYYPLDVDLDVSAVALPNLWASPCYGIAETEHGRPILLNDPEQGFEMTIAGEVQSEDEFQEEYKILSRNPIDLAVALRTIHELAMADGDLGYEYWHGIGKLLQRASDMQAEIDALSEELERYLAICAKSG